MGMGMVMIMGRFFQMIVMRIVMVKGVGVVMVVVVVLRVECQCRPLMIWHVDIMGWSPMRVL